MLGAFEAWLLLRGMRTLFLRVRQASRSAQAIAEHFRAIPNVAQVLYPGLADDPGHAVAKRQMKGGFGGMLSIRVQGGREAALAVGGGGWSCARARRRSAASRAWSSIAPASKGRTARCRPICCASRSASSTSAT